MKNLPKSNYQLVSEGPLNAHPLGLARAQFVTIKMDCFCKEVHFHVRELTLEGGDIC